MKGTSLKALANVLFRLQVFGVVPYLEDGDVGIFGKQTTQL
jgi:hypothetical protein